MHGRGEAWRDGIAGGCRDEARHLVLGEAAERQPLAVRLARELAEHVRERIMPADLDVAIRADDEQPRVADGAHQKLQQQERRLVGAVEIVEQQHQRRGARRALKVRRHGVERPKPRLLRRQHGRRLEPRKSRPQLGREREDVGGRGPEVADEARGLLLADGRTQDLHPRPECRRTLPFMTAATEDARATLARVGRHLLRGPRLADSRLADEEDERTDAVLGVGETRAQPRHRSVATDERRGVARRRLVGGYRHPDTVRPARSIGRRVARPRRRRIAPVDGGDEAIAAAVDRLDDVLAGGVIVERLPRRGDASWEHRLAHELPGPEMLEQLVLGDDAVATLDEVAQDVEDLRLELHEPRTSPQLEEIRVELEVADAVDHRAAVASGASLD